MKRRSIALLSSITIKAGLVLIGLWVFVSIPVGFASSPLDSLGNRFQEILDESVKSGLPGIIVRIQKNKELLWEGGQRL